MTVQLSCKTGTAFKLPASAYWCTPFANHLSQNWAILDLKGLFQTTSGAWMYLVHPPRTITLWHQLACQLSMKPYRSILMFHPLWWSNYLWNQIASLNTEHALCIQQVFQSCETDLSELLLFFFYKNIKKISFWCHVYFCRVNRQSCKLFYSFEKRNVQNMIRTISLKSL